MNILDFYVHSGAQSEFFKLPHNFFLANIDGTKPTWDESQRPLPSNVTLISIDEIKQIQIDLYIYRLTTDKRLYNNIYRKIPAVAHIQTAFPEYIPDKIRHIVWNSEKIMLLNKSKLPARKHRTIYHGLDPEEFKPLHSINRNNIGLIVANEYKTRSKIMGYDIYESLSDDYMINVLGAGNKDVKNSVGATKSMQDLLFNYSSHKYFLNTTIKSAMPRSRVEAAMCGMPIITTGNYDFPKFFKNKEDALICNNIDEFKSSINLILNDEDRALELGYNARQAAIKHFHIDNYLSEWDDVIFRAKKRGVI